MAIAKQPCKNHPEKFTTRKCFHCKEPICIECHQHYFHHIFCSLKCAIFWRVKDIFSVFKTSKEFGWLLAIILLSNIILYNLIVSKFESIEQRGYAEADSFAVYPAPEGFVIDSLRNAIQGKFKIDVQAEPDMVLTLSHNGKFVETLLPRDKDFSFENVVLVDGNNTFSIWGLTGRGQSVLVDSFSLVYKAPRLEYLLQPVYRVRTDKKYIAFTFDGGSSNNGTTEILDILRKEHIKCTMFLTGEFIRKYPDIVKLIIEDGHEVANHSLDHPHLTDYEINGQNSTRKKVNRRFFRHQLNGTDSLFYNIFKKRLKPFWRAPYGEINREILFWAAELGYRHVGWSSRCDSWDWVVDKKSKLYRTSEEIRNYFLDFEEKSGLNGRIILMHLGTERKDDFPYETLDGLIKELKKRGYAFKPVSELLKG